MSKEKLQSLRKQVDNLDEEIIKLLKKRFKIAVDIWKIKKPLGLAIKNPKREKEIILKGCEKSGFNKKFMCKFYNCIFEESRRLQKDSLK